MSLNLSESLNEEKRSHKIRQNFGNTGKKVIVLFKNSFGVFLDLSWQWPRSLESRIPNHEIKWIFREVLWRETEKPRFLAHLGSPFFEKLDEKIVTSFECSRHSFSYLKDSTFSTSPNHPKDFPTEKNFIFSKLLSLTTKSKLQENKNRQVQENNIKLIFEN